MPEGKTRSQETTEQLGLIDHLSRWWHRVAELPVVRYLLPGPVYTRLMLLSPLVGLVAAFVAAAFYLGLHHMSELCLKHGMGYVPPPARGEEPHRPPNEFQMPTRPWAVVLIPAVGGLVCGLIVWKLAPEAEGHGTDAVIRAFHRHGGYIRPRVPFVKGIASIVTIGTGGSAGREGPIAQIAAGIGSIMASWLRLTERERRGLMMCGAGAGVAAIFHSPLGGALFAAEVLYSTAAVEHELIVPATIAAVVAYSLYPLSHGEIFVVPSDLQYGSPKELVAYLLFAIFLTLCGWVYVRVFYGARDYVFRRLPVPFWLKTTCGALMLGCIALVFPQVLGGGYGWIQQALDERLSIHLMLALAFMKIVATAVTISSGGSGGVFAPSLFIGAMLGGAFGKFMHAYFPELAPQPAAFVLVGMSGFFAGVAKVPLTVLIMVCEMTGSYDLIVPLMLVNVVTASLSRRWRLYEEQVPLPADSPAHAGEMVVDVLERLRVADVYDRERRIELVKASDSLGDILELVANSENTYFPVVDERGNLIGIFSLRDLRSALVGVNSRDAVRAIDIATFPVLTVSPSDDLGKALKLLTAKNIEELPVVEEDETGKKRVKGFLSRRAIINAYREAVERRRGGRAELGDTTQQDA